MATISTALRKFQEPSRDDLNRLFFALPGDHPTAGGETNGGSNGSREKLGSGAAASSKESTPEERGEMEINAVLSLGEEGVEDSYVRVFSFAGVRREARADFLYSWTEIGWEVIPSPTIFGFRIAR